MFVTGNGKDMISIMTMFLRECWPCLLSPHLKDGQVSFTGVLTQMRKVEALSWITDLVWPSSTLFTSSSLPSSWSISLLVSSLSPFKKRESHHMQIVSLTKT